MDKQKALNKIKKLIDTGNKLLENKEYYDINSNSLQTRVTICVPNASGYRVDGSLFKRWESEIRGFLSSDDIFKASLSEFNKKKSFEDLATITENYNAILIALQTNIEDDIIKLENNSEVINGNVTPSIFIGHGRSNLWNEVARMLRDDFNLDCINYFEKNSQAGRFIGDALRDFQNETTFAIIVMTAEDEMKDETLRARQNVVHEIGFFQGKLGFEKVAILKQKQVEAFSNIDGLQYIEFDGNNISQAFYELQKMLKREHLI